MIKTNAIIKDNANNPVFVVIDYQEYLRIIDELEDAEGIERDLRESFTIENEGKGKPFKQILAEIEADEKK